MRFSGNSCDNGSGDAGGVGAFGSRTSVITKPRRDISAKNSMSRSS